jgi:hypothetical protein
MALDYHQWNIFVGHTKNIDNLWGCRFYENYWVEVVLLGWHHGFWTKKDSI